MKKRLIRHALYVAMAISILAPVIILFATTSVEKIPIGFAGAGVGLMLAIVMGFMIRKASFIIENWLSSP